MKPATNVPLNSLRVFEVAARLSSFKGAAAELNVTASAVSRQITVLEGYIGAALFNRDGTPLTLTPIGRSYFESVSGSLQKIYIETARMRQEREGKSLSIYMYPTFAVKWFMPRLMSFYKENPYVRLNIVPTFDPEGDAARNGGFAIILHKRPIRTETMGLFKDYIQPFCAPSYFDSMPPSDIPALLRARLLSTERRRDDWSFWFRHAGIDAKDIENIDMLEFPLAMLAYRAAADGLGVIIGQLSLLEEERRNGGLVPLFHRVNRGYCYSLVNFGRSQESAHARRFSSWLKNEATLMSAEFNL